jgi:mono/diheme cytochrome c family protein
MRNSRMGPRQILVAVALGMVLLAACGIDANDTLATARLPMGEPSTPHQNFLDAGCASCHGRNGEGGVGTALPGHTEDQVRNQVRRPIGAMPAFTTDQVSDAQLTEIVDYVLALEGDGGGHAHDDGGHGDTPAPESETGHAEADGGDAHDEDIDMDEDMDMDEAPEDDGGDASHDDGPNADHAHE